MPAARYIVIIDFVHRNQFSQISIKKCQMYSMLLIYQSILNSTLTCKFVFNIFSSCTGSIWGTEPIIDSNLCPMSLFGVVVPF